MPIPATKSPETGKSPRMTRNRPIKRTNKPIPGPGNGTDPNDNNPESDGAIPMAALFPETKPGQIERLGNVPDPSLPSWRDEVADFWQGYEKPLTVYVVERGCWNEASPGYQLVKAPDSVRDFSWPKISSRRPCFSPGRRKRGPFPHLDQESVLGHVENCLRRESPGKQRVTRPEWTEGGRRGRWWPKSPQGRLADESRASISEGAPEVTDAAAGASDVADELDWASQRTWLFLLWIDAFELWNTQCGDWKRWRLFSKLMLIPYAQAQIAGQRAAVVQAEQGTADPADQADQADKPKQEAGQGKIQINQIYAECGYDTTCQAYYAFEKFKKDFDGCVREVLRRQYAGRGAAAKPNSPAKDDAKLAERIDGPYGRYRELMAREIDWGHQYPGTGEPGQRDALDQFLQRMAGPVHMPLSGDSELGEAGELAAPGDELDDPPDLEACTMGLIAAVLTQTTYEPTREDLEVALCEYLSLPWTSVVAQDSGDAGTGTSVRDVIYAAQPCSKHWRAIKDAAGEAREAGDGEIWTDALGAVYFLPGRRSRGPRASGRARVHQLVRRAAGRGTSLARTAAVGRTPAERPRRTGPGVFGPLTARICWSSRFSVSNMMHSFGTEVKKHGKKRGLEEFQLSWVLR